jgi:hypothetical protein
MFEDYLQDAFEFLSIAERRTEALKEREAKRYYRASIFYAAGAIEAFVNYVADSFAKAERLTPHEVSFLNDRVLTFSAARGLFEKTEYHKLDDKIRLLMRRFVADFNFQDPTWVKFMEFKAFRDVLVHPRQVNDEMDLHEYRTRGRTGLKAIIGIMSAISKGVYGKPLRPQLLDLMPE